MMKIKKDNSFIITVNGLAYHTKEGDKYYKETLKQYQEHPELFTKEEEYKPNIEEQKLKLKEELENNFYNMYPLHKQCNIAIYGTEEERKEFKEFHDKLVKEYDKEILKFRPKIKSH